jgi:hypothetical protein
MSAFYPHRYTITSIIGLPGAPLSVTAADGGALRVPSSGMDIDDFSALGLFLQARLEEFGGECSYTHLSDVSAVLIIKDGFDAVSRCNSNSLSDAVVGDMNSLFRALEPSTRSKPNVVSILVDEHTPMSGLTEKIRTFDFTLRYLIHEEVTINCHIGGSVIMTIPPVSQMARQFGIDNGDIYLVCGPISPLIGNSCDFTNPRGPITL